MSIVKSKVIGFLFLMMLSVLLNTFPIGKQNAKAATNHNKLTLTARSRIETSEGSRKFKVANSQLEWKASETAIVICDMWNQHWCKGATRRVGELAGRMNIQIIGKWKLKLPCSYLSVRIGLSYWRLMEDFAQGNWPIMSSSD